ncbi:MAG: hypothetical protein M1829_000567 [Trizodia sp. TS-e1964]|nr:MAG: hypothetical protein M1829_000567 [Trizodia sp. TS-e1964]
MSSVNMFLAGFSSTMLGLMGPGAAAGSRRPAIRLTPTSLLLLIAMAATVANAQLLQSSNFTLGYTGDKMARLALRTNTVSSGMSFNTPVEPLTPEAGRGSSAVLQTINLTGTIFLTTPSTVSKLSNNNIAFLSCDLSPDTDGFISPVQTFTFAVGRLPTAILLYSTKGASCNYTAGGDSLKYTMIFTMTDATVSSTLANNLLTVNGGLASIALPLTQSQSQPNYTSSQGTASAGNSSGPSATTAVAMIILYSITGIITALFLVIILTGAIRAHRHPERYGPRLGVLGRPRQSRAKGLARAVLESIPIVKFGDKEDEKPARGGAIGDIELGNGQCGEMADPQSAEPGTINSANDSEGPASPTSFNSHEASQSSTAEQAAVGVIGPGAEMPEAAENPNDPSQGSALGCSICTEDFVRGEDIRLLPCNHKYHPTCVDPWLLNVSGTCPLCRIDLRPTATQNQDFTGPDGMGNHNSGELPPPLELPGATPGSAAPRSRISRYLGMASVRPEERMAALRRLQAEHPDRQELADSRRRPLSVMFRDAFRIRTRHSYVQEESNPDSTATAGLSPTQEHHSPTAGDGALSQ